jgi:predicted PurR-regulated permease PerM
MSNGENSPDTIDLRRVAAATAVAIGTVAMAALVYLLLDILLLLFLGIVVAAALRPSHVRLCRWGVPKGLAVLVIYLLLLIGLVLIALVVGPVLIEQMSTFAAQAPATYASVRSQLQASTTAPFHLIGQRLPPFEHLAQALTDVAPQLYQDAVGVTTSVLKLFAYFVTVLVVGFYWTMEVPRLERLLLSLLAVERRARTLNIWHEIESKLGGFMRGKGLAMLTIGAASAIGYALIGLPNILALAVLAGLLEAVPLIGPVLAVVPALLVALPLGLSRVLLVIGFTMILQLIENNVLVPRIMHRAVGVSALVGILAVLVFGTLYGFLGVLVAIPMTAVIQVLLDTTLVNAEPAREAQGLEGSPWAGLRTRVRALRQQARVRLRARTSRMGIDPATADHVVDAVDQQIEVAVARVETIISVAEETAEPMAAQERAAIVDELRGATEEIEQAVERVDTIVSAAEDSLETGGLTAELALAERNGANGRGGRAMEPVGTATEATASSRGSVQDGEREAIVDTLDRATQRIKDVVQDVETRVVAAQKGVEGGGRCGESGPYREGVAEAIGPVTTVPNPEGFAIERS